MKVFISGSISLKALKEIEIDYLNAIIEGKRTILIGDANGMDKAMAEDCDSALMFWDGKSKGTKHNMDCLKKLGKYYLFLDRTSPCLVH
ncbi:hypothetical protein FACS1894162_7080 [Bacteroidia bacterium]|nr:hypothetical protein FACS1894162_7080 [Bacteroidia bacterium]